MDDKPGHQAEADKGAKVPFFRVASKRQRTGPLAPPRPSRSPQCPPLRSGEVDDEAAEMVEVVVDEADDAAAQQASATEQAAAAAAAALTPKHPPKAMPRRPKSPEGPPPAQRPGARRPKSPEGPPPWLRPRQQHPPERAKSSEQAEPVQPQQEVAAVPPDATTTTAQPRTAVAPPPPPPPAAAAVAAPPAPPSEPAAHRAWKPAAQPPATPYLEDRSGYICLGNLGHMIFTYMCTYKQPK